MSESNSLIGSVFIDFDNIAVNLMSNYGLQQTDAQQKTLDIIGNIDGFLEKRGIQTIKRRAYCDWSQYAEAMRELYVMGVKPVHVKGIPGKNSADMELSLSVQEDMLRRNDIDAFIVVAGDRDYMPITNRVKEQNKTLFFISFKESLSGDLKKLVGAQSVFYINPKSGEINGPDWQPKVETPKVSKEVAKVERSSGLSNDQMVALRSAIQAVDSVKGKFTTFRTAVFLVTYLANSLNHLTHPQRKEVFGSLVDEGYLKSELLREVSGRDFYVFSVNEENDVVRKLREAMKKEPPPPETGTVPGS